MFDFLIKSMKVHKVYEGAIIIIIIQLDFLNIINVI